MFEDADYEKAIQLQEMGNFLELTLDELANRIYANRQHNQNKDAQSQLHGG